MSKITKKNVLWFVDSTTCIAILIYINHFVNSVEGKNLCYDNSLNISLKSKTT